MELETQRLLLRPWAESDAQRLYEYARDPRVGPVAGWHAHTSVENSLSIIRQVLSVPETYAVCLKPSRDPIGCVGLTIGKASNLKLSEQEGEIGYWLGVPFWGQGLIPEACQAVITHAFVDLQLETLWCGYFDGNIKSKRVQEKCGFSYHHTIPNLLWQLTGDIRTEHVTCLPKEVWLQLHPEL